MNRRQKLTSYAIIAYLAVFLYAVINQVEQFPLTWAHMFSRIATERSSYFIALLDNAELERGIDVFYKDGTRGKVNYHDLNIPLRLDTIVDGYSGLYRLLINLCDVSDLDYSAFPTPYQAHRKFRARQVIRTILYGMNKTLGNKEDDPKSIVSLGVRRGMIHFYDLDTEMKYQITEPTTPISCHHLLRRRNSE